MYFFYITVCLLFFIVVVLSRYFYHRLIQVFLLLSKVVSFYQNFTSDFCINLKYVVFYFIINTIRVLTGETKYFYKFLDYFSKTNFFRVNLVVFGVVPKSSWHQFNNSNAFKYFYFMSIQKNSIFIFYLVIKNTLMLL